MQRTFNQEWYGITLWLQTIYFLITAIWPLADIESFMKVTGPKTDIWLVKTVAVLLLAICINFIITLYLKAYQFPTLLLAICSCILLMCIDVYYALTDII